MIDLLDKLSGKNVCINWFLEINLPTGWEYLHTGAGVTTLDGKEWRGVGDPIGGRLIAMSDVEEGRFGQASAVTITLSGADRAFIKSIHDMSGSIEGREANLYFGLFNAETAELVANLRNPFPGRLTSPRISFGELGKRTVTIVIESFWSGQNFPFGGKWNFAGLRKANAGDLGGSLIGVDTEEQYQ